MGTETSIYNADFSFFVFEHYVWTQCFVVCNVHTWWDHLVMREHYIFIFKDWIWFVFPWLFWKWDVEMFTDVPMDYSSDTVKSLCPAVLTRVFLHPKRRWLVLSFYPTKHAFVQLAQSCHFIEGICVVALVFGIDDDLFSIPSNLTSSWPFQWAFLFCQALFKKFVAKWINDLFSVLLFFVRVQISSES